MTAVARTFPANRLRIICLCAFALAAAAAFAACLGQGKISGSVGGDGPYFIALARSMAAGKGYILGHGPTANEIRTDRLPLWPALLVPLAKGCPYLTNGALLRITGICLHGIGAVLIVLLTFRLWRDLLASTLAGAIFATYPPALGLIDAGYSESAFVVVATAGLLFLFGGKYQRIAGALVLGLSVLVRSNMIILPFVVCAAALLYDFSNRRYWKRACLLTAVFLMPGSLWITRNYFVTHAFPVLSTLEGETFYGANNEIVANDLAEWGYWIFPDVIPGETPKNQMTRTMSAVAINHYYQQKGMDFLRKNWNAYPRLILGRLIRGFVPIPWKSNKSSYAAFLMRGLLYIGMGWAFRRQIVKSSWFGLFLIGLFVVTLVTTVMFYGTMRFTFCLEPFLIMCVAAQLSRAWRTRSAVAVMRWTTTLPAKAKHEWEAAPAIRTKSGIRAGVSGFSSRAA